MKSRWIKPGLMAIVITLLLAACQTLPELITKNLTRNDPSEGIGLTKNNPIDNMVMVYVPAGDFLMGSEAEEAFSDEKPEHMVYLRDYWIYQTEVTNQQYRQCIQAGACRGELENYPDDTYPANNIFRWMALSYCEWAGGRLPTEAEWEKAARGMDGRRYPWGDEPVTGDRANFCDVNCEEEGADKSIDDDYGHTAPVGSYPAGASPYGALDMAGNVWEWVSDGYDPEYYSDSPYRNPKGPKNYTYDSMRGGSWADTARTLRVTNRGRNFAGMLFDNLGFRCVHPGK
jgi:formylglycine-generating enzyme required for sulfatase activity